MRIGRALTPLSDMLRKGRPFHWTAEHDVVWEKIRGYVENLKWLYHPDQTKPFVLYTDASDRAMGACLMQEQNGRYVPIEYLSKKFSEAKRKWPTCEQELYALLTAIVKWRPYLIMRHFTAYTDHKNLECLFSENGRSVNNRLNRWKLQLSEYDFTVKHLRGDRNVIADMLSRHGAVDKETLENFHRLALASVQTCVACVAPHCCGPSAPAILPLNLRGGRNRCLPPAPPAGRGRRRRRLCRRTRLRSVCKHAQPREYPNRVCRALRE